MRHIVWDTLQIITQIYANESKSPAKKLHKAQKRKNHEPTTSGKIVGYIHIFYSAKTMEQSMG
ncbi:MAG: hypothetical protein WC753_02925 [Candidatus Gracilibacteria bacterium]